MAERRLIIKTQTEPVTPAQLIAKRNESLAAEIEQRVRNINGALDREFVEGGEVKFDLEVAGRTPGIRKAVIERFEVAGWTVETDGSSSKKRYCFTAGSQS